MEEKKFDPKQIIGYALIMGLVTWMFYNNQPTVEELKQAEAQESEVVVEDNSKKELVNETKVIVKEDFSFNSFKDSASLAQLNNKLGLFAYSASLSSATSKITEVTNELLKLNFSNRTASRFDLK